MSEKLDLKLEIYFPNATDFVITFNEILEELINTFGGSTVMANCIGLWKNPKTGITEKDDITIIRIYTTKVQFKNPLLAQRLAFYTAIEKIRENCKQDTIAFTINDVMEFY